MAVGHIVLNKSLCFVSLYNEAVISSFFVLWQSEEHAVADKEEDDDGDSTNVEGTTLFVKNLNFDTNEETLKEVIWPTILFKQSLQNFCSLKDDLIIIIVVLDFFVLCRCFPKSVLFELSS